jgi:PLD-like domain
MIRRARRKVERVARFFTRLWHECPWEVAPSTDYAMAKRAKTEPPFSAIPDANGHCHAIWTHHSVHKILDAAREAIGRAERDLLLASYSLTGMASKRDLLLEDVERFKKRTGGTARLLVRARSNVPSQRVDAAAFAELGCVVVADDVNHAKCVIADGREVVLFSANFDAQHGLTSGVEAGVRLLEARLVQQATAFFTGLMRAAPMKLVNSPSHATLQRLAAASIQPWSEQSIVRVRIADADWKALVSLEAGQPVLFEQGTDGRLELIAGRALFFLQRLGNEPFARLEKAPRTGVASPWVLEEWLSAKGPNPVPRGFCAATFVRE